VNGGRPGTTPFLSSLEPEQDDPSASSASFDFFNYGVASAIANLSSPANIILQSGLRPDELPDTGMRSMKSPNVFAYMRAAGFATFLLDAQHGMGRPPNFMTDADVAVLDAQLLVRNTDAAFEEWDADRLLIPELARIVRSEERSFSYVLKIGAHFPYSVRFPPDRATFGDADVADDYEGDRARVISDYLNTIRHGVDDFLRELIEALAAEGRDVIVIYTADHGQSLFEPWGPEERRARGHGQSPNPPPHQARIPLLVFALGDRPRAALASRYEASLRDRTSAFELFPTLLRLAGYGAADVRGRYHHSIFDPEADRSRRIFVSGNHFGADGPLYREAPYRSSFGLNDFDVEPR
jgi:glucan phosphoethanolaminetransferase (alkaline phosphatase superfamily)